MSGRLNPMAVLPLRTVGAPGLLDVASPTLAPTVTPAGGATPRTYVPHVVAWNLTRRCNLACAHCYISAGSWRSAAGELDTSTCKRILDEVLEINSAPVLILSGGEPLLRTDLEALAECASAGGATVVVGTNGTLLTEERIRSLMSAGVKGVAVSVDSLEERYHDRFRHGAGALGETLAAVERLRVCRLDFIVQTTVTRGNRAELAALAEWSAERGAVAFNVYFVVPTGRGEKNARHGARGERLRAARPRGVGADLPRPYDGALQVPTTAHASRARRRRQLAAPEL